MSYSSQSYQQKSRPRASASDDETIEVTEADLVHTLQSIPRALPASPTASTANAKKNSGFCIFCWNKAFLRCLLPLLMVAGIVFGVAKYLGIEPPDKDSIPTPLADFLFSRDGWEGLDAEDLPRWDANGVLKLEMLNALDDSWQSYFNKSIDEWNTGDPNVLELSVTRVDVDSGCEFTRGKFAVCNGDYGDTGYHGVNEILVFGETITASVAKLNEFYLSRSTEARKQYTMCHEIGHGFGLPHSDENFFNLNLGNCMDYTDRPWTNTAPDTQTFELLQSIYGDPNTSPDTDTSLSEGTIIRSESISSGENKLRGGASNDNGKGGDIPESIRVRANEAASNLESKFADEGADEDWVKLHRDDFAAAFQIELGDGYFLQAHFLLAANFN